MAFFIGSGFSSGQEILQFFGAFGTGRGALGLCLSLFLLALCVRRALLDAGNREMEERGGSFSYYCGPVLGVFLEWLAPVFLFLCYCVMLSGSGSLLEEYLGLGPQAGRLLMLGLSLGTVLLGLGRLTEIIGRIGPMIVVLVFALGAICVWQNPESLVRSQQEVLQAGVVPVAGRWELSAILYAGYSILTALPFLEGLGKTLPTRRAKTRCAWYSCGAYGGGGLLLCLGLLSCLPRIAGKGVPTVFLAGQIWAGAGFVFAAVMFAGIYTTAVPMLWSVCHKLCPKEKSLLFRIVAFGVAGGAFFWGRMDFSFLVGTVYPYIGYFGALVMVCMLRKWVSVVCKFHPKFPK